MWKRNLLRAKQRKKKKKSKKRKSDDAVEDMQTDVPTETPKKKMKSNGIFGEGRLNDTLESIDDSDSPFKWKDAIYKVVKNMPDDGIKINKLQKKVISEYFVSCEGTHKSEKEVCVLFKSKLKSSRKCLVVGDRVRLRKNDQNFKLKLSLLLG